MFSKRSFASKDRAGKSIRTSKRSFGEHAKKHLLEQLDSHLLGRDVPSTSAIITIMVGKEQRLFAAHEDVLRHSPVLARAIKELFFESDSRRIDLYDEEPETFSCILEYLYKGDYYPRVFQDKRRGYYLEGTEDAALSPHSYKTGGSRSVVPTMFHSVVGNTILRDTAVYCGAERFGLEPLKRLALRKQGLQAGIEVGTILRSMRFAYANTPNSDARLRAHYLALIVRSRNTFKRSGTMQMEMSKGGEMFFDLFVAMCNHLDDVSTAGTPKTV